MIDKHLLTEADHVLKAKILSEATFSHLCISRVAKKIMVSLPLQPWGEVRRQEFRLPLD